MELAAFFKASNARFFFFAPLREIIFPPDTFGLGQEPNQDRKLAADLNLEKSQPTSENTVSIIEEPIPPISDKLIPVSWKKKVATSNVGSFFWRHFFLLRLEIHPTAD